MTEPVVVHHGREGGGGGHDEVRPSAATACWAALAKHRSWLGVEWSWVARGLCREGLEQEEPWKDRTTESVVVGSSERSLTEARGPCPSGKRKP
jgi:hypothetical protein